MSRMSHMRRRRRSLWDSNPGSRIARLRTLAGFGDQPLCQDSTNGGVAICRLYPYGESNADPSVRTRQLFPLSYRDGLSAGTRTPTLRLEGAGSFR